MTRNKKAIEEGIQNSFSTLYFNRLRGYHAVDDKVLSETLASWNKRIGRENLDGKSKKALEQYLQESAVSFRQFTKSPDSTKQEVLELVKKRSLPFDEAYRLTQTHSKQ